MTKEELMEEVKRRYPIGCVVRDKYGDTQVIKDYEEDKTKWDYRNPHLYYGNRTCVQIYNHIEWAEIISLPEGMASVESSPLQSLFQKLMN